MAQVTEEVIKTPSVLENRIYVEVPAVVEEKRVVETPVVLPSPAIIEVPGEFPPRTVVDVPAKRVYAYEVYTPQRTYVSAYPFFPQPCVQPGYQVEVNRYYVPPVQYRYYGSRRFHGRWMNYVPSEKAIIAPDGIYYRR